MRFSNENKLLIDCLRPGLDGKPESRIAKALEEELDWAYVLQSAQENGISAPLYQTLKKFAATESIPADVWNKLTRTYHRIGFDNTLFFEELKKILQSFHSSNIETIVLKGAALAKEVWGNVALRAMADIDILVRERDIDQVDETLTNLGYVCNEGYRSKEWYRKNHHHLAPYHHFERGFTIEIHHKLSYPNRNYHVDIDRAWERARTVEMDGLDVRILSPEDMIVELCLHIADYDHFVGKIKNLADIGRIISRYGSCIDWNAIARESRARGYSRLVYYPLFFAEDILGAEIAHEVMEELKNACALGFFQDTLLKLIVRNNILLTRSPSRMLPVWMLRSACGQLLRKADTHNENGSLLRVLTEIHDTSATGSGAPSLPKPVRLCYPILGFAKLVLKAGGMAIRAIFHRVGATLAR